MAISKCLTWNRKTNRWKNEPAAANNFIIEPHHCDFKSNLQCPSSVLNFSWIQIHFQEARQCCKRLLRRVIFGILPVSDRREAHSVRFALPKCRTERFSRCFVLPTAIRLFNSSWRSHSRPHIHTNSAHLSWYVFIVECFIVFFGIMLL